MRQSIVDLTQLLRVRVRPTRSPAILGSVGFQFFTFLIFAGRETQFCSKQWIRNNSNGENNLNDPDSILGYRNACNRWIWMYFIEWEAYGRRRIEMPSDLAQSKCIESTH